MPLKECQREGKPGWKCGDSGKCYVGPGAKKKAIAQCIAIDEEPSQRSLVGSARTLSSVLDRATARVLAHEDRLASAATSALRTAGRLAAKRFQELAGASLTAAGEPPWVPPHPNELIDLEALVAALRGKSDPIRLSAIEEYGRALRELHPDASWDVSNPLVGGVLAGAAQHVQDIADTTRLNLMRIVGASYDQGLSIDDTARAIRAGMSEASTVRGRLIARTELAAVTNGGSLAATKILSDASGQTYYKRWMTAPGAAYPRHEEYEGLDGQTVALDDAFDVGGVALQFPGDPGGPPEEVCNCRCDLSYVESPDEPLAGEAEPPAEMPAAGEADVALAPLEGDDPAALAATLSANAQAMEPYVSEAMRAATAPLGGFLQSFGSRLKTEASIDRKITTDLGVKLKGLPNAVIATGIKDSLRYTAVYRPGEYVDKMTKTLDALRAAGIQAERIRATWGRGEEYAGTNAVMRAPNGFRFELQFHTPQSYQVKEFANHADYEVWRKLADKSSPDARALWDRLVANTEKVRRPPGIEGWSYDGAVSAADVGITPFREGVDDPVGFYDSEKFARFEANAHDLAGRFGVAIDAEERATGVWEGAEEPSVHLAVHDGTAGVRAFSGALARQYRQDGAAIFTPGAGNDVIARFHGPVDPAKVYEAMAKAELPAGRLLPDGTFEIIGSGPEFIGQLDRVAGDMGTRYDASLGKYDLLEGASGDYEKAIGDAEGPGGVQAREPGRAAPAAELPGHAAVGEGAGGAQEVARALGPLPEELKPFDLPVGGFPVYRTEAAHEAYKGKAVWGKGRYFALTRERAAELQLDPHSEIVQEPNLDLVDQHIIPAEARLVSLDADAVDAARAGLEGEDLRRKVLAAGYDGVYVKTESMNLGGDQIVLYREPQAAAPTAPGGRPGRLAAPTDVSPPPSPAGFTPPYPPSEAARFGPDRLWGAHAEIGKLENAARAELPDLQDDKLIELLWTKGAQTRKGELSLSDVAGDQQVHTVFSDGHFDVADMVDEAFGRGEQQLVISDHSHLLTSEEITVQHREIDRLNDEYRGRFKVLKGIEANILADGSLDVAPEVLAQFDVVNAAIHDATGELAGGGTEITKDNTLAAVVAEHPSAALRYQERATNYLLDEVAPTAEGRAAFRDVVRYGDMRGKAVRLSDPAAGAIGRDLVESLGFKREAVGVDRLVWERPPDPKLRGAPFTVGGQPLDSVTARLLRAMDDPELNVLVHPHSVAADWDAVATKAAQKGIALEVNGRDMLRNGRQEAAADMIAAARRHGAQLVLGSDAHTTGDLVDLAYAVRFASRHGVAVDDLAPIARAERIGGGIDLSSSLPERLDASAVSTSGGQVEPLGGGMNEVWKVETEDGRAFTVKPEPTSEFLEMQGFAPDEPLRENVSPGGDLEREKAAYVVSRLFNEVGGDRYHVNVPAYRIGEFTRVPTYDGMELDTEAQTARAGIYPYVEGTMARDIPYWSEDLARDNPAQLRAAGLFDAVIGNVDRHVGNFIFGDDGNLWLIDHGLTFPRGPGDFQFQNTNLVDQASYRHGEITDAEADFLRSLLDNLPTVESELRQLLEPGEIEDMQARIENMLRFRDFDEAIVNRNDAQQAGEG